MKKYSYDAAGRMIEEKLIRGANTKNAKKNAGAKMSPATRRFKYGWLDKVLSVEEDGKKVADYDYHISGQLAQVKKADGNVENFVWDSLALLRRGKKNFVNEPYVTGGNPVIAYNSEEGQSRAMFNDMLGSTIATFDDSSVRHTNMTLFGEVVGDSEASDNDSLFFTGKPEVEGLGHAFLFRNYRPNLGKWQTADPLGYPDGLNNMAYCNNGVDSSVDPLGLTDAEDYFWGTIWIGLLATANTMAAPEYASSDKWNYRGFLHWLEGGGDIELEWEKFDNSKNYESLLAEVLLANAARAKYVSTSLQVGQSKSFGALIPRVTTKYFVSHNNWISHYEMNILAIDSITVTRVSSTKFTYTASAAMMCYDKADFNPGESFGPSGVFQDDWFIYMRNKGVGVDYDQTAYGYFSKSAYGFSQVSE